MSEKDPSKKLDISTSMSKMSPEKKATHALAAEMAGKVVLDIVGTPGIGKKELNELFRSEYTIRRNELEHIAGHKEPYAEQQLDKAEQEES